VKNGTDKEDWRKKHLESLGSLESEQRRFRAMETTLKRLAGRLCSASLGQSSRLDDEIRKLQKAMRGEATSDELDQFTPALTDAIQALDQPDTPTSTTAAPPARKARRIEPVRAEAAKVESAKVVPVRVEPARVEQARVEQAKAGPTQIEPANDEPTRLHPAQVKATHTHSESQTQIVVDDERVRAALAALLNELRRDPELLGEVEALDSRLAAAMTADQLPDILSKLAGIVGRRIQRIERSKQEVEALLSQMVGKLDEIGLFVAEQNQHQSQSQASSETLNTQLVVEMKAMGESVEAADDVKQIREQVRGRLASIDRHLQEFQQREATRTSAIRTRNEQMRARVTALEAEASRLHDQLKDEQRLSTIDALTRIPNRLAYEKRMEEELQRWQRFQQPTCLAVWDVDHFKRINDTYGHRAGDRVLTSVADCLAHRIRGTDFIARYGGEEFVMILPGTALGEAVRVMDEMRVAITKIGFHFRGTPLEVTVSSGVTALTTGDSPNAAFDRADRAMYQAKQGGRNRCVAA
jgi:diguanylate cyclase